MPNLWLMRPLGHGARQEREMFHLLQGRRSEGISSCRPSEEEVPGLCFHISTKKRFLAFPLADPWESLTEGLRREGPGWVFVMALASILFSQGPNRCQCEAHKHNIARGLSCGFQQLVFRSFAASDCGGRAEPCWPGAINRPLLHKFA